MKDPLKMVLIMSFYRNRNRSIIADLTHRSWEEDLVLPRNGTTNNATGSSRVPFMNLFIAWVAERLGTEGKCGEDAGCCPASRRGKQTRCTGYQTCWYSLDLSRRHRRRGSIQIGSRAHKISRVLLLTYTLSAQILRCGGGTRLLIRRESLNFVLSNRVRHRWDTNARICVSSADSLFNSLARTVSLALIRRDLRALGLSKIRSSRRVKCCRDTSRSACRATLLLHTRSFGFYFDANERVERCNSSVLREVNALFLRLSNEYFVRFYLSSQGYR